MTIKKIYINTFNDRSVGIFGDVFTIDSKDYIFDSSNYVSEEDAKEELEIFRKKLEEAFEFVCDTPQVVFDFEDIDN